MAGRRDYYEVLGVPRDADAKTIKSAFRVLARRYHLDISTEPDAEQRFREIAEAYGVLSDPARRASYDTRGFVGLAGTSAEDLGRHLLRGHLLRHRDRGHPAAIKPAAAPALRTAACGGRRATEGPRRPAAARPGFVMPAAQATG
jgi:curved DNA-binding protein CbpA